MSVTALAVYALGAGIGMFITGNTTGASNWVVASGGLGLIVFSAVQLRRDVRHDAERRAAARARLKPAAWIARRMCEAMVNNVEGRSVLGWVMIWNQTKPPHLRSLQRLM